MNIIIKEKDIITAANESMDAFINVFYDATMNAVGGTLTAENMAELNADQITLIAYISMREEVMDGGFVQLIHNGYGGFIYENPFAKMLKTWGLRDLSKIIFATGKLYREHREAIEQDCNDDEFMALFERFPEFDDYDDAFVEGEEQWTESIAHYIDENISKFASIEK